MGGVMSCSVCSGKGQTTVQCGLVMTCPGCRGFGHELPKKRETFRRWKPSFGEPVQVSPKVGGPAQVSPLLRVDSLRVGEGCVFLGGCWVPLQKVWEASKKEPVFAFDLEKTPTNEDGLKVILTGEGE